ncbi:dihydrofolate reductase family protein [Secundilactobacillus hailunensis]|uniref:Dihydrofolate reductase family protein n=1 Tax=Secundilactobacillus hailunensis TaxID=2559923 RepID=A0ABW1TB27_9LACO|nr:dihydrofolate reductase family protein [Secundilactobacillus hailunensis]
MVCIGQEIPDKSQNDGSYGTFVSQSVTKLIEQLRQQTGKAIWIMGGASIVKPLIAADLIDEYHLMIVLISLGAGVRLFEE